MVFNATFNDISVLLGRKLEYPDKTTNLLQVIDKLYDMTQIVNPITIRSRRPLHHFERTKKVHISASIDWMLFNVKWAVFRVFTAATYSQISAYRKRWDWEASMDVSTHTNLGRDTTTADFIFLLAE